MKLKILLIIILFFAAILRLYKLSGIPPSLYWDETSLGYNAYLIATSGYDEHSEFLPLARFIAFGDNKPPGYIYTAVPAVFFFGLNEFSVRFPSVVAGLSIAVITFLLTKEFFNNNKIALLSCYFLAISPWAIQFSRAAFEANLAACFNLLGVYLFLRSIKCRRLIVFSIVCFILAFYTFNANRIISPLIMLGLSIVYMKNLIKNPKWLIVSLLVSVVMILPSIRYLSDRESRVRFQEVSIFNNFELIKVSNNRIALDNQAWWANLIHNRRIIYVYDFLKHYFDNFSGRFLFTHGDVNPRLSIQEIGELYIWDLPFLLLGIYWLVRKRKKALLPLIIWMLIVPIPAGMARETPHALRIVSILSAYQIIIAYGVYMFIVIIKRGFSNSSTSGEPKSDLVATRGVLTSPCYRLVSRFPLKFFMLSVICFLLSVNFFYYLHNYYIHYPVNWSGEWQYGYKEMVSSVLKMQDNYDSVFVTEALGRPYIYFAFYKPYSLEEFLYARQSSRDWFGFWTVSALGKIKFGFAGLSASSGKTLLVTTPDGLPGGFNLIHSIKAPDGKEIFILAEKI